MRNFSKLTSIILLGSISLYGAGTLAGTQVDNSVKLNYKVDGTAKSEVVSNTNSFLVDNKIDLTVAHQDSAAVSVKAGDTAKVLKFIVTNTGNKVQDYSLTSTLNDGNPFGETDNFNATNVKIYVDGNANGTYEAGDDTKTYIDELAPDASITVFIVADIPSSQSNGDVSEHTLTAQVAKGGTSGSQGADITSDDSSSSDTAMGVEIVFADGDGSGGTDGAEDGKYADNSAYKVSDAQLTVNKTSCVVSDPYNGTTNPKRIPGATIRYAIEVVNSSTSKDATDVVVTDSLSSELDYQNGKVVDGTCNCGNPGNANSDSDVSNSGQDVTINYKTVTKNTTECGYIEVKIK
jgi:uncharacterized repeat protein (TIGR01451 family)